jgi:uncharacterized protein YbbC (DUF1343 family)
MYIYTIACTMEAAIIVLDGPNPLGGTKVEGAVLDPKYSSFVGMYPIPLRHGMTVGDQGVSYFDQLIGNG